VKPQRRSIGTIWSWPALLAALTLFGLSSALLGQGGVWWVLSWLALAVPLLVIGICIHRRRRPAAAG
jgi:dolichyl-phosphate-mannose--protein O-mannosyl transferase